MRVIYKGPAEQWIKAGDAYQKTMAHAATVAIRQTGAAARDAVKANIAAAGFGATWQDSIRSVMHPSSGEVLNPFAWIHSTKNFSDVFETGKAIIGKPWLWLPLPDVPLWPGDPTRQMSPAKFVSTVGPLFSLRRPGKTPILAAVAFQSRAAITRGAKLTRKSFSQLRSAGKQQIIVPMFVGVKTVQIEKRFDAYAAIAKEAEKLDERYKAAFVPYEGRR